jgi:hypothetical protein
VQDCAPGSTCSGVCSRQPGGDGGAAPDGARGKG